MDNKKDYTPEEMQKLIDKAKKDLEETLSKMTPEERAEAERKAKQMIEEDNRKMQELLESVAAISGGSSPSEKARPKFCSNCGAPAGEGKFCEHCGSPLA